MGKIYQVVVDGPRGEKLMIDLGDSEEKFKSTTVRQLKEKIAEKLPESAGEEAIRLIYTDKPLEEDSQPLSEYGVEDKSVILMVLRLPGGLIA